MKNLILIIKFLPVIGTMFLLIKSLFEDEKSSTLTKNWNPSEGSFLDLYALADSAYKNAGGKRPSFEYILSSNSFGDKLRITPVGENINYFDCKEIPCQALPEVLVKIMVSGEQLRVKSVFKDMILEKVI